MINRGVLKHHALVNPSPQFNSSSLHFGVFRVKVVCSVAMSLTADEVNILVYRYLEESGFAHTAFSFVAESQITKSPTAKVKLPPGALLAFLQKGLQYTEIEAHLNEDGTAVPF